MINQHTGIVCGSVRAFELKSGAEFATNFSNKCNKWRKPEMESDKTLHMFMCSCAF